MNKEEYNKEWIDLSQQIQKLEKKRRKLYDSYEKEFGPLHLKIERGPSKYYDLSGVDIDLNEERKLVNQNKDE